LFIIIIIVGIILWSISTGDIAWKELSVAFLASLGTFLGALFAFRLNESKDYSKQQLERRTALSRALFILARQRDAIKSLIKLLAPYKAENGRAINLPAYKPPQYADLKQNFEDLEFLLQSDYINILMRLTIEQERFHQSIESLRIRNDFYIQEVQPQLEKHSLNGKNVTDKELRDALGERIFGTAINYANVLYSHIYENEESIKSMHLELFDVAKKLFPNDKFLMIAEDKPADIKQ